MTGAVLYLLFFLSGISGLIYQVVWVRAFGHAFGNTIYSASLVVAIFMLGLGVGAYVLGAWADRRYAATEHAGPRGATLLRAYGYCELVIAALGLAITLVLPHLDPFAAALSSYDTTAEGWHVLTPLSYLARALIAIVLLAPVTLLMGGTLTLLIRHVVRADVGASGGKIALLYGLNTAGAAAGAFLTDFALVPVTGLLVTQVIAVVLNAIAGLGALALARFQVPGSGFQVHERGTRNTRSTEPRTEPRTEPGTRNPEPGTTVPWTAVALAVSGFAAMGMEIVWLRHFNLLLGGFRAVFSLLMTVILAGIGIGALLGGAIDRRVRRPVPALMVVQALFVAATLAGVAMADVGALAAAGAAVEPTLRAMSGWQRSLAELWYDVRPMIVEAGVPALLMGCSFPLANAVVQNTERAVGARAGLLYLANTAGAVAGSLVTGFLLLPAFGMQASVAALAVVGTLAIGALFLAQPRVSPPLLAAAAVAIGAAALWIALPAGFVLDRALPPPQQGERVVALSEGATELIAVTEIPGRGRSLMTNGHAMSSTAPLDQRYMRALAHVPLLAMTVPERVLVIGFGVGNTTHAVSLHPSVRRIDVADLSKHILDHAAYFRDANGGVLTDPRVAVYLNDGRQHLQMQPPQTYDLITLEPPPISHAGVAALYSREFYTLARSRLREGGYLTQWLPAYQVPAESSLAMVRAFIDVFPQAVLLSGSQAELLLVGTTAPRIEIDPNGLATALDRAPAARDDLVRLDLGTPREIVGSFIGSAGTLARATQHSPAATDDRPLQEYGVQSVLSTGLMGLPASLVELGDLQAWCPRCFDGDRPVPAVEGLDTYLSLLNQAYTAPVSAIAAAQAEGGDRRVFGSRYLGAVVPDNPAVKAIVAEAYFERGRGHLDRQQFAEAAGEFRAALAQLPDSADTHNNLGVALASMGNVREAAEHFREALRLEPELAEAQRNLEAAERAR